MIKHFVDIDSFSIKEINQIFSLAMKFKKNEKKYKNILNNKSLALLFEKESTRTRVSFNIGMQKLGGNVIELNFNSIGFGKRESEEDILKVLSQYIDCIVIRNHNHKKIKDYASLNVLPIINGLSNHSHPCQILSDVFTLKEKFGNLKNIKICWIGDYNNVLRSLLQIQKLFLFELQIALPKKIIKNQVSIFKTLSNSLVGFTDNINKAVKGSDCVMTDTWISMGEKKLKKKINFKDYQVNDRIMKIAKKKAVFMHCLPAYRGKEVTNNVIDGRQSIVWEQAKNRIYVQQAILYYILN